MATLTSPELRDLRPPRNPTAARWFIGGLAAAVALAVLPFVTGLLGGAVLTVVVGPIHRRLEPRVGVVAAAWLSVGVALAFVLVPGALLALSLGGHAPRALQDIESSAVFKRLAELHIAGYDVGRVFSLSSAELAAWLSRQAFVIFGSATRAAVNLLIALFGVYYLLLDGERAWAHARKYLPFSDATVARLRERFILVTEAMLLGILVTALAQGTVVGTAFWAVGLSDPLFWAVVTGCVSVLPVLGSALVWLPATAVLLAEHRFGGALFMGICGAVVASNIDNLLRPIVYRRISHIHPMVTVVGAFAGVGVFGLVGLLLGPLAISYLLALIEAYESEYRNTPARPALP